MPGRGMLLPFALIAALTCSACGDPPDKEIQQAQGAIDAAKAVGADQYAGDEFAAAKRALANANEAVVQRDYRLALNHALDARDRAQTAAKQAADNKAKARVDADRAVTEAGRALVLAQGRLKAAETARVAARTLADPRRAIASAERDLQKARTDLDRGAFLSAAQTAQAATARLQAVEQALEPRSPAGPRRRH